LLVAAYVGGEKTGSIIKDGSDCPEMVVIPSGSFTMGGEESIEEIDSREAPRHNVTLAKPFAIGKYEVTQAEWEAVMGGNPSEFKAPQNPVETVSWDDAQEFISRLNARTGLTYRLPTEAEWEYAARAGSDTAYSFGGDTGQLGEYAWFDGNSGGKSHPVGLKKPNAFGLYDMHGNVWEWVEDCYHEDYVGAPTDGSAWGAGPGSCRRVYRGGSWNDDPWHLRSALRLRYTPDGQVNFLGFRLARTLP